MDKVNQIFAEFIRTEDGDKSAELAEKSDKLREELWDSLSVEQKEKFDEYEKYYDLYIDERDKELIQYVLDYATLLHINIHN